MNRKITILISLLLVSVLLALPVFATTGSGFAAASVSTVEAGDTVEAVFYLKGFEKVNALSVSYKVPAGTELVSAQWLIQGTISDVNTTKAQAVWTKADPVDMTESTAVFKVTLKVLEPAADATEVNYKVEFQSTVKLDATLLGTVSASASFALKTGCDHSYGSNWTYDTQDHWHVCANCDEVVDKAAHTLKWVVDLQPTETAEGKRHQACEICEYTAEPVAIEKLKHEPVPVTGKKATCTENGIVDHFYCEACDRYYASVNGAVGKQITRNDLTIKATGHAYGDGWKYDAQGHWHACANCDKVVDKAAHTLKWVVDLQPTETAEGKRHQTCEICEYTAEPVAIEKLKHEPVPVAGKKATCTENGIVDHFYCEACDRYYASVNGAVGKQTTKNDLTIKATGHAYGDGWKYDAQGHWQACTTCGKTSNAVDHKLKWVVDTYPTEATEGKKHQTCEICEYTGEPVVIEKLKHSPVLVAGKQATCTEDGLEEHFYCSSCGGHYTSENGKAGKWVAKDALIVKATGHSFAEAWATDEKSHWHVCKCGETDGKVNHEFELTGAKEATAEEPGYTGDAVCKVCEYIGKKGEEIPCLETEPATEPAEDPSVAPTQTQPAQTEAPGEPDQEKKGNPAAWIVPLTIAAAAAVVVPIVIKRKRK